jgi:hypothetical protein
MADDDDGGRVFPVHRMTPDEQTVRTAEQAAAAAARYRTIAQRIREHLPPRPGS